MPKGVMPAARAAYSTVILGKNRVSGSGVMPAAVAASAVVLTAGYMLWMLQRVWLGPVNEKYSSLPDLSAREAVTLVPLAVIVIVLGVYPHAVLDLINVSLIGLNATVAGATADVAMLTTLP